MKESCFLTIFSIFEWKYFASFYELKFHLLFSDPIYVLFFQESSKFALEDSYRKIKMGC